MLHSPGNYYIRKSKPLTPLKLVMTGNNVLYGFRISQYSGIRLTYC